MVTSNATKKQANKNYTEDPRYNHNVCYQEFWCKIEFAVITKLDRDLSKTARTDTFEQLLL